MRVSPNQYRQSFLDSAVGAEILQQLQAMEADPAYITNTSYAPASEGGISFADKHFAYLSLHQNVKPSDYLANLRLKTKVRA